jgi:hypothetical protein
VLELCGVESGARGEPVAGAELEEAATWPVGQHPEQVAQVQLGVEVVESGRSDEGEQVACGLRVIVASDEEPCLALMRCTA